MAQAKLVISYNEDDSLDGTVEIESKEITKVVVKVSMGKKDTVYINYCNKDGVIQQFESPNSKLWYTQLLATRNKPETVGGICSNMLSQADKIFSPFCVKIATIIRRGESLLLSQTYSPVYSQSSQSQSDSQVTEAATQPLDDTSDDGSEKSATEAKAPAVAPAANGPQGQQGAFNFVPPGSSAATPMQRAPSTGAVVVPAQPKEHRPS